MTSANTSCCAAILNQQQQQVLEYCTQGCSEASGSEQSETIQRSKTPASSHTCTVVENGRVVVKRLPDVEIARP